MPRKKTEWKRRKQDKTIDLQLLKLAITQVYEVIMQYAKPNKPVLVELVRQLTDRRPEYFAAALVALKKAGRISLSQDKKLISVIYERVE